MTSMINAWDDLHAKCYDADTQTVSCGSVQWTPHCYCADGSTGVAGLTCADAKDRADAAGNDDWCTDDNLQGTGTNADNCEVTCGVCECAPTETVDCATVVNEGAAALMGACVGDETYVYEQGYAPYADCLREATATCEPMDCANLYLDVHEYCEVEGADCSSGECTTAMATLNANAATCVGPNTVGDDGMSLDTYHSVVVAKCAGCMPDALHEECTPGKCGADCASVAKPFFDNYDNSNCASLLAAADLTDASDYADSVLADCTIPCTGLRAPVDGSFGDCPTDGILTTETCDLECNDGFVKSGEQPECFGGVLTSSITCACPDNYFADDLSRTCKKCHSCGSHAITTVECGYDS
eukprot:SAG11_NODE_7576_length_1126_cov_1.978578_1_plen_355_part_01